MKKNTILKFLITTTLCILSITLPKLSKIEERNISAIELTLTQADMSWTYVKGDDANLTTSRTDFLPLRTKFLGIEKKEIKYPNVPENKQSWTHINLDDTNSPSTDSEFASLRSKIFKINKKEIKYPNVPEANQSWTHINLDDSNSPSTKEDFELLRNNVFKK